MDSPPDLSPNAPPANLDDANNYFASLQAPPVPASTVSPGQAPADGSVDSTGLEKALPAPASTTSTGRTSTDGSVDSTGFEKAPPAPTSTASTDHVSDGSVDSNGFEKVDHDVLEEYGQQFVNQMQQALFGKLPDVVEDDLEFDAGFGLVGRSSFRATGIGTVHLLMRTPDNIERSASDDVDENQDMPSGRDDVIERSYGDLIDIPRNEPHPEPPKPIAGGQFHEEGKPVGTPNLTGFRGDTPHDVHDPKPVEPKPADVQPVHDHFQHSHDDIPFEPVGRGGVPLDHLIEDQAAEVHGDVDEILHRVQETDEKISDEAGDRYVHHSADDSDSDQPDFRSRTPEVEESTFGRQGPLTIPEVLEKSEIHSEGISGPDHHDEFPSHGFGTQPRPPTPPKDISEENVKPSAFSLAHSSHTPTQSHHDGLHSILKHSSSIPYSGSKEPWIDFKTIDPHSEWLRILLTQPNSFKGGHINNMFDYPALVGF